MPLSEHEQRALEALEHALGKQDPDFAQRVRLEITLLQARRRRTWAAFGVLLGLGLTLGFCFTTFVALGFAGSLLTVVSLFVYWLNASRIRAARLDDPSLSVRAWRLLRRSTGKDSP